VKAFAKTLLGLVSVVAINLSTVCPVMSISPEDVQKKLRVIAVFVLVNEQRDFFEVNRDDKVIVPVYLKATSAKKQLDNLLKSKKGIKGSIEVFSLDLFYKKAEKLRKLAQSKDLKLETPIVVERADMDRAKDILRSEGLSDEDVARKLRVPIFFAEPMIGSRSSDGRMRQVFFVSHEQLLEAIALLPQDGRDDVKERVADIGIVLDLMKNTKDDDYLFMPTKDYLAIQESYLKSRQKSNKGK